MASSDVSIRLQTLRKHLRLTQGDLARKLKVSLTTVNRWERGRSFPSPLALEKISKLEQRSVLYDSTNDLKVTIDRFGQCDWSCLLAHRDTAREVISTFSLWYQDDLCLPNNFKLTQQWTLLWQEALRVSNVIGVDPRHVIAANLFYDTCRTRCGCTAFAVKSADGPLHGHSLDWAIYPEVLRQNTQHFTFAFADSTRNFHSVGWPGFLGVLIGFSTNRFSITLNAVWSDEHAIEGGPVVFKIRDALSKLDHFSGAVEFFTNTPLLSDCLLLVTGTRNEEMVVIERTPSRSFTRYPIDNFILVTNHYCSLRSGSNMPEYISTPNELFGVNSRERYDSVYDLLKKESPQTIHDCYLLLGRPPIVQDNTVLRVAMQPSNGQMLVEPHSLTKVNREER